VMGLSYEQKIERRRLRDQIAQASIDDRDKRALRFSIAKQHFRQHVLSEIGEKHFDMFVEDFGMQMLGLTADRPITWQPRGSAHYRDCSLCGEYRAMALEMLVQ